MFVLRDRKYFSFSELFDIPVRVMAIVPLPGFNKWLIGSENVIFKFPPRSTLRAAVERIPAFWCAESSDLDGGMILSCVYSNPQKIGDKLILLELEKSLVCIKVLNTYKSTLQVENQNFSEDEQKQLFFFHNAHNYVFQKLRVLFTYFIYCTTHVADSADIINRIALNFGKIR